MKSSVAKKAPRSFTLQQYFDQEIEAVERHEFREGQIVAMAGSLPAHSLIVASVIRELGNRIKGKPCRVYDCNLRVRIQDTLYLTYPDASVVCGPLVSDPSDPRGHTITNPKLIVEVLSPSTEAYDRGDKFSLYRRLDSLREYVLVAQDTPRVETYFRKNDGTWVFSVASGPKAVTRLRSLSIDLPLAEV